MPLPPDAWRAKARLLDRYRWRLLRERHGLLGSCLRFGRDGLTDLLFGLAARLRAVDAVAAEPCDFLLLQSAPKVILLERKKLLKERLRQAGHCLVETALQEPGAVVGKRELKRPPQPVPLRYYGYAAHAEWLVARHDPRVLLNDRNGSLYSPFLRLSLNGRGRPLVHLAHATTMESSRRLGMNDYDYYLLFGRSSLEALEARALRFGESTVLLSGSHMVDGAYDLPPADPGLRTLLILGVGPDKEKEEGYRRTYTLLREWAAGNPAYRVLVKAHPRSKVPFWQEAAAALDNVRVLPGACSLAEALGQASVVVNIMSNAVIEATLARRPVIYVNASGEADIFDQARFFGACVDSPPILAQRVGEVEGDYHGSLGRSAAFAEHHLAHGVQGLDSTLAVLESLLAGRRCEGYRLQAAGLGPAMPAASCAG